MSKFSVVICGGGVAAVEALLRLHRLAAARISMTLVTLSEDLSCDMRALGGFERSRQCGPIRIARAVEDCAAVLVPDEVAWVDRVHRVVHTESGVAIPYDALLLAVDGRRNEIFASGLLFPAVDYGADASAVPTSGRGDILSLAFVVPSGPGWPLPLFELALAASHHARSTDTRLAAHLVIPRPGRRAPLAGEIGLALAELLREAGIALHVIPWVDAPRGRRVRLSPRGAVLDADFVVSSPAVGGPSVRGIPGVVRGGFLRVDQSCRVRSSGGPVFAAGDATAFMVKHESLSAQQADVAAAAIARLARVGAGAPTQSSFVVRSVLRTPGALLYMTASFAAGPGWRVEINDSESWTVQDAIGGLELPRYLRCLDGRAARSPIDEIAEAARPNVAFHRALPSMLFGRSQYLPLLE